MAFDAYTYFENIRNTNKIAKQNNYHFCRVTGITYMEDVIQRFKTDGAFFCIDDTEDGVMMQSAGGGYMERRQYTVFLLKRYPFNNMPAQHSALEECRTVYRQTVKKLIHDRRFLENEMTYLHVDRIPFYEIPGYFINGCAGLYFMITVDIPTDLCYDGSEWDN